MAPGCKLVVDEMGQIAKSVDEMGLDELGLDEMGLNPWFHVLVNCYAKIMLCKIQYITINII